MYPEPGSTVLDSDLRAAFSNIVNNHPALLRELQARPRQMTRLRKMGYEGHALNAGGPLLNRSICRFGARMGLALHFRFAGRIVPAGGSIAVKWMTNVQLFEHGIPREIIELIGPPRTLRQGSFNVGNQFMYSGVTAADTGTMSAHVATFRQSFGIIAFVAETVGQMDNWRSENVYEPGFLKRP